MSYRSRWLLLPLLIARVECVTIVALRYAPADGAAYGNVLYMIELASPPMVRSSGVGGLSLDDYCSINTSLKTLTKCVSPRLPRAT